jgi:hypothetical protein
VLRYITCPHWHAEMHFVYTLAKMCLFNTCLDIFWVLVGMLGVWVTYVGMHFLSSMAWNGFGGHMLRCISSLRWHGIGLCQLKLRHIWCPRLRRSGFVN